MKKITFVIADLGAGGAQRVMSMLANDFSREELYQIDIISTSLSGRNSFYPYDASVRVHYCDIPSSTGSILSGVEVNIRRVAAVRGLLKEIRPDVVVSFLTEINCITLLAAIGTDIPVVISERSDPYYYPSEPLWQIMRRLVYRLSSHLVCQTQYAAGFFKNLSRKSVIYNPVAVDNVAEAVLVPVPGPYILGVGRLSPEKGFDLLIEAHALANKSAPELKLVLIGDGPERNKLEALALEKGTADHVIFLGAQKHLASYYKGAAIFVLPSHFEGMPGALLEAMAYGCPVIVTPHFKAAPEIVDAGKNGILLNTLTREELSSCVLRLYEDPSLRMVLGSNAMETIGKFSRPMIYKKWRQLLADFL